MGQVVKIQLNGFAKPSCILPGTAFKRPWLTNEGQEMLQAGKNPTTETFTAEITDEIKAGPVRLRGDAKYGFFVKVARGPLKIRIPVPIQAIFGSLDTQREDVSGIGAVSV